MTEKLLNKKQGILGKIIEFLKEHYGKILAVVFVATVMIMSGIVAKNAQFDAYPDESIRYDIVEYVRDHMDLPRGDDPSIRDEQWGFSYAYYPITSYVLSGVFMKVASWFTDDAQSLLFVGRLVNVIFVGLFAVICVLISKELFSNVRSRILFCALCGMSPMIMYIGGFINNDAICLFATAAIIYAWILGIKREWSWKTIIFLGITIGFCFLTYFNTYGFILCSAVIFVISGLLMKKKWKEIIVKGLAVVGVAFVICGWWFIRNAVLYNGDFLGIRSGEESAEMYAMEKYKPSNRETPENLGQSLGEMLFDRGWIMQTFNSFIGYFGQMRFEMEFWMYRYYKILLLIGGVGGIVWIIRNYIDHKKNKISKKSSTSKQEKLKEKSFCDKKQMILFESILVLVALITVGISIYYSFTSDFQPQGRYIITIIIPLMYFVVKGIDQVLTLILKEKLATMVMIALSCAVAYLPYYTIKYIVMVHLLWQ